MAGDLVIRRSELMTRPRPAQIWAYPVIAATEDEIIIQFDDHATMHVLPHEFDRSLVRVHEG